MRIVVLNHVSLDGVMQAPGRPDEDTRGGFAHGGWAAPNNDEVMGEALGTRMTGGGALLFGRRTYEDVLGHWNAAGGPFKEALNAAPKYVASTSAETALEWPNSNLLHGNVPAAVRELKAQEGDYLTIMGSGRLIHSLMPHGLIDEFFLMIHPVLLGGGLRLFPERADLTSLALEEAQTTTKGVIIATYRPAGAEA